ncbi:hypothetical protein [Mesorhizobium sp. M0663]|uniref:hypothetical protein n=1 Tax=Mesorhizobium sp. M0663 TaxID=2956981 RepID=UPI0033358448
MVNRHLEGIAVEIAGALVEQASHQIGQSLLASRVLRGAAVEDEADGSGCGDGMDDKQGSGRSDLFRGGGMFW